MTVRLPLYERLMADTFGGRGDRAPSAPRRHPVGATVDEADPLCAVCAHPLALRVVGSGIIARFAVVHFHRDDLDLDHPPTHDRCPLRGYGEHPLYDFPERNPR